MSNKGYDPEVVIIRCEQSKGALLVAITLLLFTNSKKSYFLLKVAET